MPQQQVDSIMEKIQKKSGVLLGNCWETLCNILQKTPVKEFTKKKSLTRSYFRKICSSFLYFEIFDEVT